jgi:hypothetical protein
LFDAGVLTVVKPTVGVRFVGKAQFRPTTRRRAHASWGLTNAR